MTTHETFLDADPDARARAVASAPSLPSHLRSALATRLGAIAREAAASLAEPGSAAEGEVASSFARACLGLSVLRVEAAKNALLRLADEGTPLVKTSLAHAIGGGTSFEARAVLVHLLSDDDAIAAALVAIGRAPWPEILPALIEIAESDDRAARLAATAIAKSGVFGSAEAHAAADFLYEQLDDDDVLESAGLALLRFGRALPGLGRVALAACKGRGARKVFGLCLTAAASGADDGALGELARGGAIVDDAAARSLLDRLLADADPEVRSAAKRVASAIAHA